MKRVLSLISLVSLLMISFSSCKKEDSFSVSGKTFTAFGYHADSFTYGIIHYDGYDAYYVLRFISETTAERSTREGNASGRIIGDMEDCKVTINYPLITISYMSRGTQYTESGAFLDKTKFRLTSSNGKVTSEYILQ